MSRSIIILFFLLNFNTTFCSDSLLVDTTKTWSVLTSISGVMGMYEFTASYKIGGDTLINDTLYSKIIVSHDSLNTSWYLTSEVIRQDSNKVYLRKYGHKESLIYDFNLKIGDTITQTNILDERSEWILENVDSVNLNGIWRKQWTFEKLDCGGTCPIDIWFEGIGSIYGINTPGYLMVEESNVLLCVKQGDNYIYINPYINLCYIYYSDISEREQEKEFKLYPNPCGDYLLIETENINYCYRIITLLGQTISTARLEGNSTLNISRLKKGIYILRFQSENSISDHSFLKE
jgi:hypothetical protein